MQRSSDWSNFSNLGERGWIACGLANQPAHDRSLRYHNGMRILSAAALLLWACSSTNSSGPAKPPAAATTSPAATPTSPDAAPTKPTAAGAARECLPIVADKCGCVYSCGVGVRQPDGSYAVHHEFWKSATLKARVADWCAGGKCTPAFHAEIVCDLICAPKPADATCHFEGDQCLSGNAAP